MEEGTKDMSYRQLQEKLEETEQNLIKAAEFGKFLLDEKENLENKLDQQMKMSEKKLESAEQEKHGLRVKLDQMTTQSDWYNEAITDLRHQLSGQEEALRESYEAERQQEVSKLTRQIDDLRADLEQSQLSEANLKEKNKELDELLQEKLNRTVASPGRSFLTEELGQLQDEIANLECENTTLKGQLIEQKSEIQAALQERDMLRGKIICRDDELDSIKCQFSSVNSSLEQARMEKLELRAQLDALRMESGDHKKKGNSLFAELEDRRVDAEKKCLSLEMQVSSLKEKYEVEKQQNLKYKRQITQLLFEMSSGKVDCEQVSQLEYKLNKARQEIQELLEEKKIAEGRENVKMVSNFGEGEPADKDYAQFLLGLVKGKEEELEKCKQNLRVTKLQLLDEEKRSSYHESKILELESERDKFRSQNMKLAIKLEELRLKYDPESLKKGGALVVKKIEKIPLAEPETVKITETSLLQNSTINQSQRSFQKDDIEHGQPLVEKHIDNVPSVELKSSLLKRKTVSISDEVESYDEEKNCEITELKGIASEEKLEKTAKVKSRGRGLPVKYVSSTNTTSDQKVNDCKSQ